METAAPATPAAAPGPAVTPAATPEPAATAAPAPEAKPDEQQPPERTFSQKELDEIVEKRLAKERRKREDLQRRLAVTEELALKGRAPTEPKADPKPAADAQPKREDFPDYESFIEARAEWRAERKVEERLAKDREDREKSRTDEEQKKVERSFRENSQKVMKEIEDFEEVVSSSQAMITREMADAIMHAGEIGPRLLYHLAKDPEEAQRIASLPAPRQAAEIGKLEVKLSGGQQQPTPKPSKAPEPINPLGGKSPATDDEPDAKNTKAWIAWRERQLRAKRG